MSDDDIVTAEDLAAARRYWSDAAHQPLVAELFSRPVYSRGFRGDVPVSLPERFCQSGENAGKPGPCPEHADKKQGLLKRSGKGGHAVRVGKVIEHRVLKAIQKRVPPKLQKAAMLAVKGVFSSWIPAQAAAFAVAREVGGEHHARKVARVLLMADLAAAKIVPAVAGSVAGPMAASAAYMTPLASTAYLGYSTARHPLATLRAAKKAIKGVAESAKNAGRKVGLVKAAEAPRWQPSDIAALLRGFERAGTRADRYEALVVAALGRADNLSDAISLADGALGSE